MPETQTKSEEVKIQSKIYDHLFIAIFGKDDKRSKKWGLELSNAFMCEDKSGKFEWTARVLNINKDKNLTLQKKCKPLYDYIQFTSRINENKKTMTIEEAVDEAVEWACEQNLLEGYIKEQKAEVKMDLLTEYDEEACIRGWRRDGILIGRQEKAVEDARSFYANGVSIELIAKSLNMQVEEVKKIVTDVEVVQP